MSSRQGSRGPVLRAVPEHCHSQEEPQAQGLPVMHSFLIFLSPGWLGQSLEGLASSPLGK